MQERAPGTLAEAQAAAAEVIAGFDDARLLAIVNQHDPIGVAPARGFSRREQAGVMTGEPSVLAKIAELDRAYRERFGAVFLIRSADRTAADVLAALRQRLAHGLDAEMPVIRAELTEIVTARLSRVIATPTEDAVR